VTEVEGIEYCLTHGGVMTEGTDYSPEGLGCEYPWVESDDICVGTALYYERPASATEEAPK
jgi:hypothetical protein